MKFSLCQIVAIGVLALLMTPAVLFAQAPSRPTPPPGPLVAQPPDPSQVVITFSYAEERAAKAAGKAPPPAGGEIRTVTMTRTGDIVHQELVDGLGTKVNSWHVGDADYSKAPDSDSWSQAERPSQSAGQILQLDWINAGNYVGTVKYAGRDCLVFIQDAPPRFDVTQAVADEKLDSFHYVAFVDKETRLPIEDHAFGVYRYFRFGETPAEKQTLPPDLAAQLKAGKEMMDRLSRRDIPQ